MLDYCRHLFISCGGGKGRALGHAWRMAWGSQFSSTTPGAQVFNLDGQAWQQMRYTLSHLTRSEKKLPYNEIGGEYQFGARVYLDPLSGFELQLPRD